MDKVSVVIVKYKAEERLKKCLDSIPKNRAIEVITVDNDKNNRGFSRAVNLGAKRAKGRYLLILNPDCVLNPNTIPVLVKSIKSKAKAGVVGPQLTDEKGQAYLSFTKQPTVLSAMVAYSFLDKWFPNNKISRNYWYKGRSLNKPAKVESISGAAMLVDRCKFLEMGGFDERFFMYWEDNDICARYLARGEEIWFEPRAAVMHSRAGSTRRDSLQIKYIFWTSRLKFFWKYFGLFYGTAAAVWLWVLEEWQFCVILLLTIFLRFWRLPELMPFIGDQGRDFLAASQAVSNRQLPLLGIESSVPRFAQGPLYVWGLMIFIVLGLRDPVWAGLAAAATGVLAVIFTYFLVYRFFSRKEAILTLLTLAAAPLVVTQARLAFMTNPIPLMSVFYLYNLFRPYRGLLNWFLLVFSFALLFQYELAVLPLGLLIVWYGWNYRKEMGHMGKVLMVMAGAFALGMLPQVIFDFTHKFRQLSLFGIWVVYRMAAFLGFDSEHAASVEKIAGYGQHLWIYFSRYFIWGRGGMAIFYLGVLVLGALIAIRRCKDRSLTKPAKIVWAWLLILLLGFMVHSAPSEAYFPVLFVPLSILVAWSIEQMPKKMGYGLTLCLAVGVIYNSWFLINHEFMMTTWANSNAGYRFPYGTPLSAQKQLIREIKLRYGENVKITYKGEGAEIPHFLDGYLYLGDFYNLQPQLSGKEVEIFYDELDQPGILKTIINDYEKK